MGEATNENFALFRRERRWRRVAAVLLAPSVIAMLYALLGTNYFGYHPQKALDDLIWCTGMAYIGSLPAAGLVGLVLRMRRWRPRTPLLLGLFPLACACIAALSLLLLIVMIPSWRSDAGSWSMIPGLGLLVLLPAIPVALAYCLIAGVPWRRSTSA